MGQLELRGKPIGIVKGILFDKDGTLSYSEPYLLALASARITALRKRILLMCGSGATAREVSNLLASAYGVRLSQMQKATDLNPEAMLAVASLEQNIISTAAVLCLQGYSWSEALRLTKEAFSEADILSQQDPCFVNYLHLLVPGVRDMLTRICGAGITCAIISNDTDANIDAFLRCQDLGALIIDFCGADKHPNKPSPKAVYKLCQCLGLKPVECALISDSETDLLMARQAGIGISIGFASGWSQSPCLSAYNYLIGHWEELTATPVQ